MERITPITPETNVPVTPANPETMTPKGGRKKLFVILVIVGLLVVIGLATIWAMSYLGSLSKTNDTNNSSSANSIAVGENGTELTEAQQVNLFKTMSQSLENKQRAMKVTITSANGEDFIYVTDPAQNITGYYSSTSGVDTNVYITADGQYFQMEGTWYFMPTDSGSTDASTMAEVPDYSNSDLVITDEQEIASKTTYQGTAVCPGTYQGTCHKFTVAESTGTSTAYINMNGDLVYTTTTDSSGTTTADFVYEGVTVSLPAAAADAINYNNYIQSLTNGF